MYDEKLLFPSFSAIAFAMYSASTTISLPAFCDLSAGVIVTDVNLRVLLSSLAPNNRKELAPCRTELIFKARNLVS